MQTSFVQSASADHEARILASKSRNGCSSYLWNDKTCLSFQPPFFFAISIHLPSDSSSPSSLTRQRRQGKNRVPDGVVNLLPSLLYLSRSTERARDIPNNPSLPRTSAKPEGAPGMRTPGAFTRPERIIISPELGSRTTSSNSKNNFLSPPTPCMRTPLGRSCMLERG